MGFSFSSSCCSNSSSTSRCIITIKICIIIFYSYIIIIIVIIFIVIIFVVITVNIFIIIITSSVIVFLYCYYFLLLLLLILLTLLLLLLLCLYVTHMMCFSHLVFACLFVCTDGPDGACRSPLPGVPGPGVARQCTTSGSDKFGPRHYAGQTVHSVVHGAARRQLHQHEDVQGGGR